MIQSLHLKPRLQLHQPLQDGAQNLRRKVAIGTVRVGGGGDEFAEDQGDPLGGEALEEGSRRFPGGGGVLDAGESESEGDSGAVSVFLHAFRDVVFGVSEVPCSGPDLHVHDGGVGVGSHHVLEDEVGVGPGAVGGGDDGGAVERREEGADRGRHGEGGVEGELGGASVVVLQWLVELSRIIHQRTQNAVLRHVTRHLVLRHFQHFHDSGSERRRRCVRKKTHPTIHNTKKSNLFDSKM